ncbi:hypothetical protein [Pseudomonas sp. MRSN 12121]|uniref:hypothetical protein n=1 Tax=Pseudomonas sp. MRSN 12121 TaxID=1611770 RepID=UPI0005BEA8F4|nr:hypothetical protein [Pseudomonas sp. MRSN 12121]AJO76470.1 hypothetical protein TO66_03880 [Pseudomonas sp. MRSN 12121]
MHPKNSTTLPPVQDLLTVKVEFCNTPISNTGAQMLNVAAGIGAEDALQTAKVLSSGLGQICRHMHDSLNMGELAYCDGVAAMAFLAETVSALVWSVERGFQAACDASGEGRP